MLKRFLLLILPAFILSSCEKEQQMQAVADETLAILMDYLPYAQNDTFVFVNNQGDRDVLRVDTTRIYRQSGEGVKGTHVAILDSKWTWYCWYFQSLVSEKNGLQYDIAMRAAYGNDKKYIMLHSGYVSEKLSTTYNISYKVNEELPDKFFLSGTAPYPQSYMRITRHKGLTEYSFDSQEIWRLEEK